jgi:hypothetical protein
MTQLGRMFIVWWKQVWNGKEACLSIVNGMIRDYKYLESILGVYIEASCFWEPPRKWGIQSPSAGLGWKPTERMLAILRQEASSMGNKTSDIGP